MAVNYEIAKVQYLGDGTLKTYTFPFKINNDDDIRISIRDTSTGNIEALALNYDYSVSFERHKLGGSITLINELESAKQLTIFFDPEFHQDATFKNQGTYYPETHENALDRLTQYMHSLKERFKSVMSFDTAELIDPDLPTPRPNHALMVKADGSGLEWVERSVFKGDQGDEGPSGTIDALAVVGEVEYEDGTPMSVTNVGTPQNAILEFVLRKGPKGEKGESVEMIKTSEDLPDNGYGGNGDIWIVLDDAKPEHGNLYQKELGNWEYKGNIKGPAGGVNSIDTEQGDLVYDPSGLFSARFNKIITATTLREVIAEVYDIQYVGPAITLTSNIGVGPYEKGQAITAINFTAAVVRKSNDIAQVEFLQGASVLDTQTSGGAIPSGGNSIYNWTGSITDTTSFTARVTDVSGGGGPTTATGTRTFSYIYAYYHGAGNTGLNAAQIAALTKVVATPSANQRIDYTLTVGQVPYFAYPVSVGAINQITDESGFDVTSSWTITTKVLTNIHGLTASYYCCEFNNPAGSANSTFYTFKR